MASLKPRRLFELLEEQQEPFLLENGAGFLSSKSNGMARACIWKKILKKALIYWDRSRLVDCFSEMSSDVNAAGFRRLSSCSEAADNEHSPVSVLELHHSDESSSSSSSDHSHSTEGGNTSQCGSMKPRQLLLDFLKEMDDKSFEPCEIFWPVEDIDELISLEISATSREWHQSSSESREIGREIGCLIFEEMREECVIDMLKFPQ